MLENVACPTPDGIDVFADHLKDPVPGVLEGALRIRRVANGAPADRTLRRPH